MKKFFYFLSKLKRKIIEYIITNRLFISYLLISIIGMVLVRRVTIGHVSTLYPFITDLGIILIIGALGYFIKPRNQFKYFFTWICIFCLMQLVNSVYYIFYTSFASFGELASVSQAEAVTGSIFEKINIVYVIYFLFPILLFFIHKKLVASPYYNYIDKVEKSKKMFLSTLLIGILLVGFSFANATKTDYSRLNKQWNRSYIVERFGLILYQGNDLVQTLRPKLSSLFGYEDAKELFDNYFASDEASKYKNDNKYTGILKGKNIVFVHMESIQDFVMDLKFNGKELTPNLNKLAKEGMFFSNFFPEVSTGTSSDTEFTLLSSLMPASSGIVFVSYYDRNYITIPKLLTEQGYYTFSMHGNYLSMWNRAKAHPSLGYQEQFFEDSFTYTDEDVINLGINDKLFFKQGIEIMEKIESENHNYMGTVITLSNHSPFIFMDKYGEYDFSDIVKKKDATTGITTELKTNFLEGSSVGNYLHSVHYADEALGDLIKYINESDAFNDTVFVFYGDHDAKLSKKQMNYLYNYNPETGEVYTEEDKNYTPYDSFDHDLNKKTPLIIWTKNRDLKYKFSGEVDYYMGMVDVAPTILNMFGLKNEYALGHDIFNIRDNNIVAFPNGNFVTNMLYYNNSAGEYKIINKNAIIDENYISTRKKYVEDLLDVSNSIIVYNLLDTKENNNE